MQPVIDLALIPGLNFIPGMKLETPEQPPASDLDDDDEDAEDDIDEEEDESDPEEIEEEDEDDADIEGTGDPEPNKAE